MKMKLGIFLSVLLWSGTTVKASEFFVGSVDEFSKALKSVKPGDILIWKNGEYNNVVINFNAQGNATQHIFFKAETPGKVVFTGKAQLMLTGNYLQAEGFLFNGTSTIVKGDVMSFSENASHCRFTNCAVLNYTPVDVMMNNNWMVLQGTYNDVDQCSFTGKTNQGPYLVVRYKKGEGYVDGSDMAPSTYHHIHHNYFGYRTLPTDNGGEDMRIGDSFTSFTHGFNIIEYNYFENHQLEAEVISNKSWDNIYRFNTFINNDGQMVLRHGSKCFVYGNYFDGASGRNSSGGIRIINANQTVFNNYILNAEGSENEVSKAAVVIMSGLVGSPLNGYYAADNAIVAYNTAVNCTSAVFKIGYGNKSKEKPFTVPQNLTIVNNLIVNAKGSNDVSVEIEPVTYKSCKDNFYTNGKAGLNGFSKISKDNLQQHGEYFYASLPVNKTICDSINQRLAIHNITLSEQDITTFNPAWKLKKTDVGVSWIK